MKVKLKTGLWIEIHVGTFYVEVSITHRVGYTSRRAKDINKPLFFVGYAK